MILLEFEVVDTDATHRHAFRLEDVREIISMENGARTSIRLECRERPIVVNAAFEEVMGRIHGIFQQIMASKQPRNGQVLVPGAMQLPR